MHGGALQPTLAWAEDRALLGSGHRPQGGPSADPGAKTGDGATHRRPTPFVPHFSGIGTNAKNPTRNHSTNKACSASQLANANDTKFHFTVNQDTRKVSRADRIDQGRSSAQDQLSFCEETCREQRLPHVLTLGLRKAQDNGDRRKSFQTKQQCHSSQRLNWDLNNPAKAAGTNKDPLKKHIDMITNSCTEWKLPNLVNNEKSTRSKPFPVFRCYLWAFLQVRYEELN